VLQQQADGYTLFLGPSGAMAVAAAIYPDLKYSPIKDFVPLAMIANFPLIMVIGADNPSKNLKEFIEWMKQHPDKANYASSSPAFTITAELLKLKTGMPGTMIPYKSSNEMNLSVIQGQSAMTIADGPPTIPQVKGGKVRAIAVTGKERSDELRMCRVWLKPATRTWTCTCGAAFSRPRQRRNPSSPNCKRRSPRRSPIPACRKKLKAMAVNPGGATPEQFVKIIKQRHRQVR